jgi:phosphate transport system substrate-binding protein
VELGAAREAGVELEVTPIAMDAFVFLLNRGNSLDGLTLEEIRGIYTGEITNWSEVGGPEQKINAYTRNETSGSQGLMRELVMGEREMIEARDMMGLTMMGPVNSLAGDPRGIGYSVHYYMAFMSPDPSIKLAEINGVAPTSETIRSGEYPLCSEVYAVIRADEPEDSPARKLRDWLLTGDGQRVIAESGYVPISEAGAQ